MTANEDIVQEPHDEFPDLLVGEPVAPEHDLDIESFDLDWDDDEPIDSPPNDLGVRANTEEDSQ